MTDRFRHLELRTNEDVRAPEAQLAGNAVRTAAGDLGLAEAAEREGLFERALRHYTGALGQDRTLIPAWVGQVQMLVELGEYAEARLWSDKALELFRNNGEILAAKSRACARLGDRRAAFACSDASLRSPGTSPLRWIARGEAMLAKSTRRAKDCFEKALAEADADWYDRVVIARIHLWHDAAAAALGFARAAVGLHPAHAYNWLILGHCQRALGWADEAADSYRRCLELHPGHGEATNALHAIETRSAGQWFRDRLRRLLRR